MDNGGENSTNLIINYLPQNLTDEEFEQMFLQYGPLKSCKICRHKVSNYSYGFGFADFIDPTDAARAVQELNGMQLAHKKIKVAFSKPSDEVVKRANVYVRNLPKSYDEDNVKELFGAYGDIIQVRILRDAVTNVSKSVGFVVFDKKTDAETAIKKLNGFTPPSGSDALVVKFAEDDAKKKVPFTARLTGPLPFGGKMPSNPRSQLPLVGNRLPYSRPVPGMGLPAPRMGRPVPGMGRPMPLMGRPEPLMGMPEPLMRKPASFYREQELYDDEPLAYREPISFGEREQMSFGEREPMSFREREPIHFRERESVPFREPAPLMRQPMYSREPVQLMPPQESAAVLFVYNLGTTCTESDVYRLFAPFGALQKVDLIMDFEKDCCKGYAFVTYYNQLDAEEAIIALNGMTRNGKQLQVRFKQ